jgi:hypothetical protein
MPQGRYVNPYNMPQPSWVKQYTMFGFSIIAEIQKYNKTRNAGTSPLSRLCHRRHQTENRYFLKASTCVQCRWRLPYVKRVSSL